MTIGNINNINSIFQNDWWLDAVAPKSWDSIKILNNNNNILACLPYVISKRKGFTRISMPPLTQNLGPWIAHSSGKYSKQLSFQKEMMNAIIAEISLFNYQLVAFLLGWIFPNHLLHICNRKH
jgi:hypothetical protein